MNKPKRAFQPAVGSAALLVTFGVLCLVVLSLLSLHTVLAEQRLSQADARSVTAWYEADLQAQEIYACLRGGETVPGVEQHGDHYRYCVPISEHQILHVLVKNNGTCWEVLSWQTVAHPEDGNTSLPVWQDHN
jgi:hypothetical protein